MTSVHISALLVLITLGGTLAGVVRTGNNPTIGSRQGVPHANTSFLLNGAILQSGKLFAYSGFFLSDNGIRIQIWAPLDADNGLYELSWETRYVPKTFHQRVDVYLKDLPGSECVWVREGSRLGVFTEEAPSSLAHYFNPQEAKTFEFALPEGNPYIMPGESITFGELPFPYDLSVSVYVKTGYSDSRLGSGSTSCPNEQITDTPALPIPTPTSPGGSNGGSGTGSGSGSGSGTGDGSGVNVLPGATESIQQNTTDVPPGTVSEEWEGDVLLHWHVILGILIWLAVLTIVNICLLLALCHIFNNQSKYLMGIPRSGWTDFERDFFVERKRKLHSLSTTELEKDFYSPDDMLHYSRVEPTKI